MGGLIIKGDLEMLAQREKFFVETRNAVFTMNQYNKVRYWRKEGKMCLWMKNLC